MNESCLQFQLLINCYILLNVGMERGCLTEDKKKIVPLIVNKCSFKLELLIGLVVVQLQLLSNIRFFLLLFP